MPTDTKLEAAVIRATGAINNAVLAAPPETRAAVREALDQLWTDLNAAEAEHRHRCFGHGWEKGREDGLLEGWADRDTRARKEQADKDAEITALRGQLEAELQRAVAEAVDAHTADDIGKIAAVLTPAGRLIQH